MMMSVCKNNSVNSILSHALNQTLGTPSPPPIPPCLPADNLNLTFNPIKPITILDSYTTGMAPDSAGDMNYSGNIDLMSCTESIGNESCDDMISTLDDLGCFKIRSNSCRSNNEEDFVSSPSSPLSSSSCSVSSSCCLRRRWEEKKFPPPLTSLSENGRRNFTLESTRKDGRLEIARVTIERPEFLCASRDNGRLRLHLVKDVSGDDVDDLDYDDCADNDEEKEKAEEKIETEEEEIETEEEEEETEEREIETEEEEEETEERERRIPAGSGLRRCYHHPRQIVLGPQQHRCVTTV